jgi:hypothetical protein
MLRLDNIYASWPKPPKVGVLGETGVSALGVLGQSPGSDVYCVRTPPFPDLRLHIRSPRFRQSSFAFLPRHVTLSGFVNLSELPQTPSGNSPEGRGGAIERS